MRSQEVRGFPPLGEKQSATADRKDGAPGPSPMIQCIYRRGYASSSVEMGNSLAVRIPKPIADGAHLQLGDPLEIAVACRWGCADSTGGRNPNPGPIGGPNHPGESLCGDFAWGPDRKGSRRMVSQYVPDTGDIIFLDFDPQVGRKQAKRRPALVLTDLRYNRASGLAVVCPLTSKVKPYPSVCRSPWRSGRGRACGSIEEHGLGGARGGVSLQSSGKHDRQGTAIHCGPAADSNQVMADG